jgi:crotonobetainyl-CoA:carnitine CoA-transferase CaiB-like acyl-CoA transferase
VYRTADARYIALGGAEAKFARNLLTALGRADLAPLCDGPAGARQLPVIEYLEREFATRSQAEWLAFMANVDVCYAPVNDLRAGFDLEQVRHREMRLVDERGWEHIGTPFKFRNEPGNVRFVPPGHGEHTRAVLAELGYTAAEIDALFANAAVADRSQGLG